MPEDDGKALSVIHVFFHLNEPEVSRFEKWKKEKVIAFIKKEYWGYNQF